MDKSNPLRTKGLGRIAWPARGVGEPVMSQGVTTNRPTAIFEAWIYSCWSLSAFTLLIEGTTSREIARRGTVDPGDVAEQWLYTSQLLA